MRGKIGPFFRLFVWGQRILGPFLAARISIDAKNNTMLGTKKERPKNLTILMQETPWRRIGKNPEEIYFGSELELNEVQTRVTSAHFVFIPRFFVEIAK